MTSTDSRWVDLEAIRVVADPNKKARVYLDIDGLFADPGARLPYLEKKEYDKFYGAEMAADTVHLDYLVTAAFMSGIYAMYDDVEWYFLTGRPERTRALNALWIKQHFPFFSEHNVENYMLCRKDDDFRVGFRVKWELMSASLIDLDEEEIAGLDIFFLDDDYRNIKYAYKQALDWQVAENKHFRVFGAVIGGGRLPSVHAVNSTEELGK